MISHMDTNKDHASDILAISFQFMQSFARKAPGSTGVQNILYLQLIILFRTIIRVVRESSSVLS